MHPVELKSLSIGAYQGTPGHEINDIPTLWGGLVDEVAIFNDALPADDIRDLSAPSPQ